MKNFNEKGNIILFAVVTFAAISALGTSIYFMTTTSTFSGVGANAQNRAYQLAVSGKDFATAKNMPPSQSGDYTMSNGDIINLAISINQATSTETITSTGIVAQNTPYEARQAITFTKRSQADIIGISGFPTSPQTAQAGFVSVDQTAGKISLGQLQASKFGAIWYSGNTAPGRGNCLNGKCDFGSGFRTYFTFKLARYTPLIGLPDIPNGFTFAIFNGTDNSSTTVGGDYELPELLAYGGNSCTARKSSGKCTSFLDPKGDGILPPKMAVEFDGRQNCCDSATCSPFPNTCKSDFCNSNSRKDGPQTHMAYVFWGNNSGSAKCSTKDQSPSYDDNRHGSGSAANPRNAVSTDTTDTTDYFIGLTPSWSPDWLYNATNVYAVRMEVTRSIINTNGKYFYTINTWIKRCNSEAVTDPTACSEFEGLSVTRVAYSEPASPQTLTRTIELDQTSHNKFSKFIFGWTAAAGSASRENLEISNFQLSFF
jgi:hypothetical protein